MLKNNFIKTVKNCLFILIASVFVTLAGCKKEDQKGGKEQSEIKEVPFFELAKGDTVSHDVFREKPDFSMFPQTTVLFSTESKLKADGTSSGSGYITDLKVSIRSDNTAPSTMNPTGKFIYYKIPVDLNEGAGGKWIYLYYTKSAIAGDPINSLAVIWKYHWYDSDLTNFLNSNSTFDVVETFGAGNRAELNDGAGGCYIYLCQAKHYLISTNPKVEADPISDIMIVSSTSRLYAGNYPGWFFYDYDLNRGAGGKYIYLFSKPNH